MTGTSTRLRNAALLVVFSLFLVQFPTQVDSYVMGIDLGTEWFKVSLVRQKFEIVLNEQTQRKTATAIAFQKGELIIGTEAKDLITKIPKNTYVYALQLLGRSIDDPIVQGSLQHLYYPLESLEDGSIQIRLDENTTMVPEDIIGLVLGFAKEQASKTATYTVREAVITVPPYFTQRQRQAVLDAAKLAGISVLGLLNENTAAAIHFGVERTFNETATNMIFYDIGGSSLTTSLVSFKSVQDLNSKKNDTNGQLTVEQVAWDPLLGGREFDLRLAKYFATIAKKATGEDISPETNTRAFAKLLKAAQRGKEVLSANKEAIISVERLVEDYDFSTEITREKFEELCADLFERALSPVKDMLKRAGMSISDLANFELIGGGVRIPKFHQILLEYLGRTDLDRHLNGDEANVMGAAFYGATKSSSFKVKDFKVKDSTPFGVSVSLKSDSGEIDKSTELFVAGSRILSKKTLTFNTDENITVELTYNGDDQLPAGTDPVVASYYVTGIPSADAFDLEGKPKVNAHFRLNQHGLFVLEDVDAELTIIVPAEPAKPVVETAGEEAIEKAENTENDAEKTEQAAETPEKTEDNAETQTETAAATENTENATPKTRIHRVKLSVSPIKQFGMTKEQFANSEKLLRDIYARKEAKKEKEREKNTLESYIYETREYLEKPEVLEVTNEEQRRDFSDLLSKAGDWLYDEGSDADSFTYRMKHRELKLLGDKIQLRVSEKSELPIALIKLQMFIDSTRRALENITERLEVSEDEHDRLMNTTMEVEKWIEEKKAAQDALQPYDEPVLTSQEVSRKQTRIENESRYVLRRPKRKPKVVEEVVNATATIDPVEIGEAGAEDSETPEKEDNQQDLNQGREEKDDKEQTKPHDHEDDPSKVEL